MRNHYKEELLEAVEIMDNLIEETGQDEAQRKLQRERVELLKDFIEGRLE